MPLHYFAMQLTALHHVTCICADATRTLAFYRELGFRLVKKTVNFDDPKSYHLYFGDDAGAPGTLLTFFEWPRSGAGALGRGVVDTIALTTPTVEEEREVEDPDGLKLRLVPGPAPRLEHVVVNGNADLYAGLVAKDAPLSFVGPDEESGEYGTGVTHHVAWRARDLDELQEWLLRVNGLGLSPTEVRDRKYFQSIYFRMPDGLLIEIATEGPGWTVDEEAGALGERLSLPDWLEERREELEQELQPL
jgi:glyoxalase family protein